MKAFRRAGLALALLAPFGFAHADTAADLQALRAELAQMRADYEARIQALESKLKAAEAAQVTVPPAMSTAAAPAPVGTAQSTNSFNPAVSLILSGTYSRTSRDPASYRLRGFNLPPDAQIGPGVRGFSLAESELGLAANIDPWFYGAANISFHPDNTVSVEEAYVQTTSLGHGLTLKGGRFFSSIGYLNSQHAHVWDFVDAPLAYQALLGTQYGDDGVQLAWLAPFDQFVEVRAELGRGRSYPGTDTNRNGAGMNALVLHTGGDIGESHSWRAGLSYLRARATDQALVSPTDVTSTFNGRTNVWIADAVWKWAPNGNATRTNFKLQGEYLHSTRADSTQSGWYLQGVYQFMPRWRVGLRTERIDGDDGAGRKHSVMLDYSLSEFSRIRVQLARDMARAFGADNQFWLQYQMSLGAHGAHAF